MLTRRTSDQRGAALLRGRLRLDGIAFIVDNLLGRRPTFSPANCLIDDEQESDADGGVFQCRTIGAGDEPLENLTGHERLLEVLPREFARHRKRGEIVASPSLCVPLQFSARKSDAFSRKHGPL